MSWCNMISLSIRQSRDDELESYDVGLMPIELSRTNQTVVFYLAKLVSVSLDMSRRRSMRQAVQHVWTSPPALWYKYSAAPAPMNHLHLFYIHHLSLHIVISSYSLHYRRHSLSYIRLYQSIKWLVYRSQAELESLINIPDNQVLSLHGVLAYCLFNSVYSDFQQWKTALIKLVCKL